MCKYERNRKQFVTKVLHLQFVTEMLHLQFVDDNIRHPHIGSGNRRFFRFIEILRVPYKKFIGPLLKASNV